jgi:enolase-phosphatase E1
MATSELFQSERVPKGILLDIEGTTSSIAFVYDVMFPYARKQIPVFLEREMKDLSADPSLAEGLREAFVHIAKDAGFADWSAFRESLLSTGDTHAEWVSLTNHLLKLMDSDSKSTGLKAIQGLVWEAGFLSGEIQSHLYDDVYPALLRWSRREIDLRIYSSGSTVAQKLFFGHTPMGDLRSFFKSFYDTTIGNKREKESYLAILEHAQWQPETVVFFSDNPAELEAARQAGIESVAVIRPGNAPLPADYSGPYLNSFSGLW